MPHDWLVIVVEEEEFSADIMRRILIMHDVRCWIATSAEEALYLLQQELPAAMIVNITQSGMSGWELVKHLRSTPRTAQVPVIATTRFYSPLIAKQVIRSGFRGYIHQPFETARFFLDLKRILAQDDSAA